MAAIHQHEQLHVARPAEVHQRVERGANRAPGEEHIVDEDDALVIDPEGDVGSLDRGLLRGCG